MAQVKVAGMRFGAPPGGQRRKGLKGWTGGTQRWEPKPGHRYQTDAEAHRYGRDLGYPSKMHIQQHHLHPEVAPMHQQHANVFHDTALKLARGYH